jgi:hypothetical protein
VDYNPTSVGACRAQGFEAYTVEDSSPPGMPSRTRSTLASPHMLEHMAESEAYEVMRGYLPLARRRPVRLHHAAGARVRQR